MSSGAQKSYGDERFSEHLFFDGKDYFDSLLTGIRNAQRSIRLESYIFEEDRIGGVLLSELILAAVRGVRVELLVDGIGSWLAIPRIERRLQGSRVRFRVYHPLKFPSLIHIRIWIARLNRRDHRKLCLVDGREAWIGSFNVSDVHIVGSGASAPWRDTAIRIRGEGVQQLTAAFRRAWMGKRAHGKFGALGRILLNDGFRQRAYRNAEVLRRVRSARNRIWITTPYFVPGLRMLVALRMAAKSGVDVRILLPRISDVAGMAWANSRFYRKLLSSHAAIYLYRASPLHAKTMIVDDWGMVGSSNLNHRSLLHDLEVDVILKDHSTLNELEAQYQVDLSHSEKVTEKLGTALSFGERCLGSVELLFKDWI